MNNAADVSFLLVQEGKVVEPLFFDEGGAIVDRELWVKTEGEGKLQELLEKIMERLRSEGLRPRRFARLCDDSIKSLGRKS